MSQSSPLTTHVLDTSRGRPASGVPVTLEQVGTDGAFHTISRGVTDDDGRIGDLITQAQWDTGVWRMTFDTGTYFHGRGTPTFYPRVSVWFEVTSADEHHHVPLLLAPCGYTTYRGS